MTATILSPDVLSYLREAAKKCFAEFGDSCPVQPGGDGHLTGKCQVCPRTQGLSLGQQAGIHSAKYRDDLVAETNLPFRTAREIAESTPAQVNWIAKPWVAAGAITELAGPVKSAGKTTFALHLVRAVLDGKLFLGEPTRKTPVVFLTEQSGPSLRQALERTGLLGRDDLVILRWHDTLGTSWPEVVEAAVNEAHKRGASLLVVDTLSQFAGLRGDWENSAGAAQEALGPVQRAAGMGLAVLLIRHERKSGGGVGEAARGSSAFGGGCDILLSLRRAQGDDTRLTVRTLNTLSRFDETPPTLVIDLTIEGYVAIGSKVAFALEEAKNVILDTLPLSEEGAWTIAELLDATGVKRGTAQTAIKELLKQGDIRRIGKGKKNDPYRYYAASPNGGEEENSFLPRPHSYSGRNNLAETASGVRTPLQATPAEEELAEIPF